MAYRCIACKEERYDISLKPLPLSKYRKNGTTISNQKIQKAMLCNLCFDKLCETKYHPLIKGFYCIKDRKVISVIKHYADSDKIYIERPRNIYKYAAKEENLKKLIF